MKPLIISFIVFTFLGNTCFAQKLKSDSLKIILQQQKTKDTNYVNLIFSLADNLYKENNVEEAKQFTNEGIALAEKLKWHIGHINGLFKLDRLLSYETKYDSAAATTLYALDIAERIQNKNLIAIAHSQLSGDYLLLGNFDRAENHVKKFLDAANDLKDSNIILTAMVNLVDVYISEDKTDLAKPIMNKALQFSIAQRNNRAQAKLLYSYADIQTEDKNYASALEYRMQSLPLWKTIGDYGWIAYTLSRISMTYSALKNKDSAAHYAYAALELAQQQKLKKELVDSYEALFICHNTFGDYKQALEYRLIYDSLFNKMAESNISQNSERTRMKLEQEKKDLLAQREQEVKDAAARKSRNLQYGIIGGFILLAGFLFYNNRQKQKAKTKIEEAYGQLKSTQAQLVQSEKMASLGELTAGIAHEIQNPLNFVNNFSDVNKELLAEMNMEMEKGNYEEVKEIAKDVSENEEKINHHGKRADAIVKGMLQHSRSSSGVKEPTDINALADEYLRLSYHGLRAKDKSFNATMKTDFDESIGNINIIPQDIGRVILNLITNAFYAVDERKKLGITEGYEPTVVVSTKKSGDKISIVVKDNGNGIPQKVLDKIFQPFFTTKPTGQGTGLGLSMSYDIVKAHGGEIKVETIEGEGSEFIIQL